jgi:hypothetical protein
LTLVSQISNQELNKTQGKKKFGQGYLKKKFVKLASKNIIFEVFGPERGSSEFFMADSFFQSRNTHSGQFHVSSISFR